MLRKVFLIILKYMPIIQMVGILVSNVLYFLDVFFMGYLLDFLIGNSLATTLLLYAASFAFKFCAWHRLIITSNFAIILFALFDSIFKLPITDIKTLTINFVISSVFIILATYSHIKDVKKQVK